MINETFFSSFLVENLEYCDNSIFIILKSKIKSSKCPYCGKESSRVHSKYTRLLLDLPMIDKSTRLKLITRRFYCTNAECGRKIFSEQFDGFVSKYKRVTERLSNYLLKVGLSLSASQGCRLIKNLIPISVSTLLRITKSYKIDVSYDAEYIGIDDFSFKKGTTFGTIICDLKTGKPIDVINSRNLDKVTEHLKNYKKAKVISRDRSTTYAKAIKDAIPSAAQVADRFHIIHNFFECVSDFLKRYIGKSIKVSINDGNSSINKENDSSAVSNKQQNRINLILKVKQLYNSNMPIIAIARELSIARNTVRKYIKLENVDKLSFYDKPTSLYMYKDFIINLLINKKSYKEILLELEKRGVNYSYSSLAKYASDLKKKGLPKEEVKTKSYMFTRFNLMKIFWNFQNTDVKVFKMLNSTLENYPLLDNIFTAVATLKDVFKSKNLEQLNTWIHFNKTSEIKEVRSFVNGIEKDFSSVENSVIFIESNGTLEGNVNKLKMIKRSMYGRASFELLRKKVLSSI